MPKAMQYAKGSVVYFEDDKDERIFILQKGIVLLIGKDIETGRITNEQVHVGEFFGVKSALGRFPREETAQVLTDTVAISMTVSEFEKVFTDNKQLIMKMLRVFSNQLRGVHKKIASVLASKSDVNPDEGMFNVAQSFFNAEDYKLCAEVCSRYVQRYPNGIYKNDITKLFESAKKQYVANQKNTSTEEVASSIADGAVEAKHFVLQGFSRFAKTYEPGSVIIAEYEPGDSFYLIQSGRVQLLKCVNGSKKNLDILMPSEFFGEMAILENTPRSASCIALDSVEVLEFNKENFEVLITGNPQIALILLKLFCKRIYDQRRRFKTLIIKDLQARIADVFLMLDDLQPPVDEYEKTRKFNITLNDVGYWAGLPADIVRDEIAKLEEKHRLEVYDNHIIVTNMTDLKRFVEQKTTVRAN